MRLVIITPAEEGGYTVEVPSLSGCISRDETVEEAVANIREAIALYIDTLKAAGRPMSEEEQPTKRTAASDHKTDRPVEARIGSGMIWVTLADGRVIGNPLAWHPWLANATPAQQSNFELSAFSVDWPDLDEGLDIEGMLRGIKPR